MKYRNKTSLIKMKTKVQHILRMTERQRMELKQIKGSISFVKFDDDGDGTIAFLVESKCTQEFYDFLRSKGVNPSQPKLEVCSDIDEIRVALSDCTLDEAQALKTYFATKFVLNAKECKANTTKILLPTFQVPRHKVLTQNT